MHKSDKCILFLLFVISVLNISAQPELKFERYTSEQDLVHNYVHCAFQDNYGFMWFGTRNGVSRFDGITFKNYLYDSKDSCSVLSGWIHSIETDKNNQLLIRSGDGLTSYDYKTDCFTKYKLRLPGNSKEQNKSFSAILYDSKGLLWTMISGQLAILNLETKDITLVPRNNNEEIPEIYATAMYEDKNGFIWIGTSGEGLLRYNRIDSSYVSYKHDSENSNTISSNFIYCIYEDSRGNVWIGTDKGGLNRYIPQSSLSENQGVFEKFFHDPLNPNSLSHNTVYSICEDAENNLWIGTLNGLCLYDRDSKKFYSYHYDDRDSESLNDNIVRCLYCDKSGNFWIGTRLGIAKLKKDKFKTYKYSSYKNSLSHNKVDYLFTDAAQNIFICTPVGIDYFDRENNTFQVFKRVKKDGSCLSASPICMTNDPNNEGYWIGMYNGGLCYYNKKTQECTVYIHDNYDSNSLSDDKIFSVYADSKDNVWIGTWGNGLDIFDKKTGKFKRAPYGFENNAKIGCIYEDKDKNIWVGTKGLYFLDKNTWKFKNYLLDEQKRNVFIKSLLQSEDRNLWIATYSGLYWVNTKTGEKKIYSTEDGLPSAMISSILEDNNHNIWVSTMNGIARFIPSEEQKDSTKSVLSFKSYENRDGLQSSFLGQSCCKLNDGTIAFGGSEGLSIFHPDSVKDDTTTPKIAFINLKIFNKPVKIGEEINGRIILKQSLLTTDTIKIHYQNNNFTIEFAAFHYRNSKFNQYAYKLEGYDKEWNYTYAQNRYATYTDLPYNTYNLLVKSSNSDGIWSKEIKKLTIHVLPPWWLTTWFKILVVLIIIFLVVFWFKLKTYKLRKQKKLLEEKVEYRTQQLQEANQILEESKEELQIQAEQLASMNEKLLETNTNLETKTIEVEKMARIVHEADQSKLRFFANISHEFRTPLSLIISPLEKILSINKDQTINNYLQLMHRNAKRLFRLINEIIDFRKMDQGEKKLEVSNNNIDEFVSGVINAFSAQAEQKDINLSVENLQDKYKRHIADFWFDSDIMEKILYNLTSNAIKYTPKGGEVSIQLSVNSNQSYDSPLNTDNCLLITVKDTGIGISKENLDKIFDRFYRVDTQESFAEDGTGIGLSYTKELVLLHKGTISVESELGKGSTFTLYFPIGKECFAKEAISDKSTTLNLDYIHSAIRTSEENINEPETIEVEEKDSDGKINLKKATILLVEDNNDLRKFIREELKAQCKVLEATNGKEGWEMASEFDPELIISDIMMPVMDGIEFCKKIKADENTSHIPVILLTAKTGDESAVEGLETGANDYITKPFDINILKIKIKNLLILQKKLKEKFSQSIDIVPSEITQSLTDEHFIQKAVEIINENMQRNEFDNDMFVELMGHSRSVVYKKVKNLTGLSIGGFIHSIRLKASAKLFLEGNLNIAEVCYRVGFKHHSIFTRKFKKMFGTSPVQFIKERLKKT